MTLHLKRSALSCALATILTIPAARADLSGRVVTPPAHPVAGARVQWSEGGAGALTDADGRFTVRGAEPPGQLTIHHPFFETRTIDIGSDTALPVLIRLVARPDFLQEVEITASRDGDPSAPVGVISTVVRPRDLPAPPSSLAEMVVQVPGVSENGQGGLFQVTSIRGVSGHRVQTLVADMRITSERRAGVSASFLDPGLMESVDVLRGPASSYYGSGALGGVLKVFPRRFASPAVSVGYDSQGAENVLVAGTGTEHWSVGVARRDANDARSADGAELNSAFKQYSAVAHGTWGRGPRHYRLTLVSSHATNIGKPNTDFPTRKTVYPRETHHLLNFRIDRETDWSFRAAVHPHDLETDVVEGGSSRSNVKNDAFDFSAAWERRFDLDGPAAARLGIDLFGRRGVEAGEVRVSFDPNVPMPVQRFSSLNDGGETEAGVFGTLSGRWGDTRWEVGARVIHIVQDNAGALSRDETAASGFAGFAAPLTDHLTLEAHAGTGLRFPSLTERFFTGTTARGQVTGNPGLDSERSLDTDLGLRWVTERWLLSGAVFHNRIDDYIERVEVAPGQLTFVNLTDGTIAGIEVQGAWHPAPAWRLGFGGHLIDGDDDDGGSLADIPPGAVHVSVRHRHERWTVSTRWSYRDEKTDPGSGEKPIPDAHLVSASVAFQASPDWRLAVTGTNLLDEEYFPSADRKAVLAPGRSVGVTLTWAPR